MSLVTPIFHYQIVISMIRCNILQSIKDSVKWVQSHLKFSQIECGYGRVGILGLMRMGGVLVNFKNPSES